MILNTTMFENKAALINGASRGMGLAIAEAILGRGGKVCITSRKQPNLDGALARLDAGANAIARSAGSCCHQYEDRPQIGTRCLQDLAAGICKLNHLFCDSPLTRHGDSYGYVFYLLRKNRNRPDRLVEPGR